MAKESGERPLGARMWVPSKGLQQPEVESYFVPDDTALAVPPNCEVIEREEKVTEYGSLFLCEIQNPPPKAEEPAWRNGEKTVVVTMCHSILGLELCITNGRERENHTKTCCKKNLSG